MISTPSACNWQNNKILSGWRIQVQRWSVNWKAFHTPHKNSRYYHALYGGRDIL